MARNALLDALFLWHSVRPPSPKPSSRVTGRRRDRPDDEQEAHMTDSHISDGPQKGGDEMEITVVKVERIEATLRHLSEYELA